MTIRNCDIKPFKSAVFRLNACSYSGNTQGRTVLLCFEMLIRIRISIPLLSHKQRKLFAKAAKGQNLTTTTKKTITKNKKVKVRNRMD